MQVTKRTHSQARLQNTLFMVLLVIVIGLIAWLSTRYEIKADWTINNRHTLSEASKKLLDELSGPITITAYASNDKNLRKPIKDLVERYQRHKTDISLHFVDPFTVPGEVQEHGIRLDGELIIYYQERSEHLRQTAPSEQDLTSALQRVARTDNRIIVFLEGHGERSPTHFADHNLMQWAQALEDSGLEVQTMNFVETLELPTNTQVLVIASPRKQLLPGEIIAITDYIDKGGNLLWLIEPNVPLQGLEPLAEKFGLTVQPGMIVDPTSQYPAIVPIGTTGYGHHPVTSGLEQYLTLFPQATGLAVASPEGWDETVLLTTRPEAWSETGDLESSVEHNEKTDIKGPLDIAFAIVRDKPQSETADDSESMSEVSDEETDMEEELASQEQRVIIVGEGDFLSNAFVGIGGNLDLGMKMMNWLADDDTFIHIPTKTAVDLSLEFSFNTVILLSIFFILILPLALVSIGISIWLRRRNA
jgi:ABC-type uncharacterized transport system involved in gliding motility auxiliary subunit